MNLMAIGIGRYGNVVVEQLCSHKTLSRCVAICSTQAELETVGLDMKFRVSTRLSPFDATERIHGKLKKACADTDVVVLIANPMDFANPIIIYLIAGYIQKLNITPVGMIVNPSEKTTRKHKNAIQNTIDNMVSSFATVVLSQKCIAKYTKELNTRWLEHYAALWDGRDTIQEQEAFRQWKATKSENTEDVPSDIVQVGEFIVWRLLKAITTPYINADKKRMIDVLSIPGYLHLTTVYAFGENRYELIKWRASFNDILLTTSHAAQGMLLNLTVPETITQEEVGKICLGIYSYANESVNFYFNISFSEQKNEIVVASVLATGTYDMSIDDN